MRFLISVIFLFPFVQISLAEDAPLTRDSFSFVELNRLNFNFADGHQVFKPIDVPTPKPVPKVEPVKVVENDPTKPSWIAEKGGEDRLRKVNGLWRQKCWDGTGEWVYSPGTNSWIKESFQPIQQVRPIQQPIQFTPVQGGGCANGQCPLPTTTTKGWRLR